MLLRAATSTRAQRAWRGTTGETHQLCVTTNAQARFDVKREALAAAVTTCAAEKNANLSLFLQKYAWAARRT